MTMNLAQPSLRPPPRGGPAFAVGAELTACHSHAKDSRKLGLTWWKCLVGVVGVVVVVGVGDGVDVGVGVGVVVVGVGVGVGVGVFVCLLVCLLVCSL